ncbi:lysophospholipid acyltransferase family protein [Litorihabitans aurantiacus]|uniref:1-acyl-sn-glycerol-3-phosphate acyltransferase n=1 Tax=Litorihabitans aurantiacus TaxID=1930061 RepID=A0AA37US44_9MICO|nr:lysophospholipid acyltransferase family protein [Litorihabitans aurantiacus]GMA31193.1 1-acyl-sn-glycerol-3-phosphate acyltransferase [Litorihabitans aurantiacus]
MSDRRARRSGALVTPEVIRRGGPLWSRHVGRALAHGWWSTDVVGAEHVPAAGRVLVAPNHTGAIDGPLVHGTIPRPSHFLVKQEFFSSRLGFLMDWAGQIPVDRAGGGPALAVARELLEEDRCVGVFPEGTRGRGDVAAARAGTAWLAVATGAPVVPCAVLGTRPPGRSRGWVPPPRTRLHVAFGEPVEIGRGSGRRAVAVAMAQVQRAMVALLADARERTGIALPDDDVAP